MVYGRGEAVSSGVAGAADPPAASGPAENRYLFVTAEFVPARFPEPPRPANRDYEDKPSDELTDEDRGKPRPRPHLRDRWEEDVRQGRDLEETLTRRFADWYYVISQESFENIRKTREDLIRDQS